MADKLSIPAHRKTSSTPPLQEKQDVQAIKKERKDKCQLPTGRITRAGSLVHRYMGENIISIRPVFLSHVAGRPAYFDFAPGKREEGKKRLQLVLKEGVLKRPRTPLYHGSRANFIDGPRKEEGGENVLDFLGIFL